MTFLPETDPELKSLLITEEAMMIVAPPDCRLTDWREVLKAYPFIRLNRNAGMGIGSVHHPFPIALVNGQYDDGSSSILREAV